MEWEWMVSPAEEGGGMDIRLLHKALHSIFEPYSCIRHHLFVRVIIIFCLRITLNNFCCCDVNMAGFAAEDKAFQALTKA